jgi:antitoxin component HigA of HigAB toxin-antitoxin module
MEIKPIVTKADHRVALKEIESPMSARPGTPDGDRLDVLVTLVGVSWNGYNRAEIIHVDPTRRS